MKTKLLTCFFTCLASAALAQGTIYFANDAATPVSFSHEVPVNPAPIVPFGGSVQLAWAAPGVDWHPYAWNLDNWETELPGWHIVPNSVTKIGSKAGQFDGGAFTIPTAQPGEKVQLFILAWTGDFESFWKAELKGMSPPFTVDTGNPLIAEAPTPILGPEGFPGYVIAIVPEPGSFALLGVGGAVLLLRRRGARN